jgi:hypothetical protein
VSLNPEISDEVFSVRVPDTYTRED